MRSAAGRISGRAGAGGAGAALDPGRGRWTRGEGAYTAPTRDVTAAYASAGKTYPTPRSFRMNRG
jgi:hypothetical protein